MNINGTTKKAQTQTSAKTPTPKAKAIGKAKFDGKQALAKCWLQQWTTERLKTRRRWYIRTQNEG